MSAFMRGCGTSFFVRRKGGGGMTSTDARMALVKAWTQARQRRRP